MEKRDDGSRILREMLEMFGHTCPSKATIYRWIERFENGDEDIHDAPHPGRPTSSKIRTNIKAVQRILYEDRRITLRALEERVGMSTATIIHKDLEMSKVSARWVPKLLSEKQKRDRVKISKELLSMYKADNRIITGDESWIHYYEPESKANRNSGKDGMNPLRYWAHPQLVRKWQQYFRIEKVLYSLTGYQRKPQSIAIIISKN